MTPLIRRRETLGKNILRETGRDPAKANKAPDDGSLILCVSLS